MVACSRDAPTPAAGSPAAAAISELQVRDVVPGDGAAAVPGSQVTVHYTGWLYDPQQPGAKGRKFDSSHDSGRPFSFELGAGQVIAGWDEGVAGMQAGGQRQIVIPASLAYGERGAGGVIPPGATLVFDLELLAVEPPR